MYVWIGSGGALGMGWGVGMGGWLRNGGVVNEMVGGDRAENRGRKGVKLRWFRPGLK